MDLSYYRNHRKNGFLSEIFAENKERLLGIFGDTINVWIGLDAYVIHKLISISRDGMNWYYEHMKCCLENTYDNTKKNIWYITKCINNYNMIDTPELKQLKKRSAVAELIFKNNVSMDCFIDKRGNIAVFKKCELEKGTSILHKGSERAKILHFICKSPDYSKCRIGDNLIGDIHFANIDIQFNDVLSNYIQSCIFGSNKCHESYYNL